MLVDTEIGTKISFGECYSLSDLGEVKCLPSTEICMGATIED